MKPAASGFTRGSRYNLIESEHGLSLESDLEGSHVVSGRTRNGKDIAIIDLNGHRLDAKFGEFDRVRVLFTQGFIHITPHHEDRARLERERRLRTAISKGKITKASMCTGGGVSTLAIDQAAHEHGLSTSVAWVCDVELKYLQSAHANNACIDDGTVFLVAKLEEIEPCFFTHIDVLSVSLPCSGFSTAGKSKHKLTSTQHDGATSIFGLVNGIRASNPAVIISENVVEAHNSAIYELLTSELERLGYAVFHRILEPEDTPTFERRRRYWFVAISKGLSRGFTFNLPEFDRPEQILNDFLEAAADIPESMWADNQYLKDKAITDKAAGKGFARQLMTGSEISIGTIGRHYSKRRSTEPFMVRESDDKERLLTPAEHARVKSIPEGIVNDVAPTIAHQILGQSIDFMQGLFVGKSVFGHLIKINK